MSTNNIDQATASLICLVDIYSEIADEDKMINACSSKASQILISGIENCPDDIKISFCTFAIASLTKIVAKRMLYSGRISRQNVLETSEIEFIRHVINDY